MPQNIFKIYDERTNFWQWDTGQKLIVLDENVTEVHFSNRDMSHSTRSQVYTMEDGTRVCNIPDILLQLPRNLVAYAYMTNGNASRTVKSVKFAVIQRPIPDDYVMTQTEQIDEINHRLEILENVLKDIELGKQELHKFETIVEAAQWAKEAQASGSIIAVHIEGKWIAQIVEDDDSLSPICNSNGEAVEINLIDGGDGDGYTNEELIQVWDGGNATGF